MRRAAKCQQCLSAASLTLVNKSVAFKDKYFRQTIKASLCNSEDSPRLIENLVNFDFIISLKTAPEPGTI